MAANIHNIARINVGVMASVKGAPDFVINCRPGKCDHKPPTLLFHGVACRPAVNASHKSDDTVNNLCIMCPAPGTLRCPDCHDARYCSQACLDLDAKCHKPLCESFRNGNFKNQARPTPHHVRVLVFPQAKVAPEFAWARRRTVGVGKVLEIQDKALADYLKANPDESIIESVNFGTGLRKIGHGIHLHWSPAAADASPLGLAIIKKPFLNLSVASLGPPGHIKPVYAHGVAFAFESPTGTDLTKVQDMTFRDARHVIDHILQNPANAAIVDPARFRATRSITVVPAIRSSNPTETSMRAINVTPDQALEPAAVALDRKNDFRPAFFGFRYGLRYWVRIPTPQGNMDRPNVELYSGFPGRHFAAYLEARRQSTGPIGPSSRHRFRYVKHVDFISSVVVVHGSGAEIPMPHMEAFCAFNETAGRVQTARARGQIVPWPAWIADALGPDHDAILLAGEPRRESFAAFWGVWKVHAGHPDMESPWDFEKRHRDETIFMDANGGFDALGVAEYSPAEELERARRSSLARAIAVRHTDDERRTEEALHGVSPREIDSSTTIEGQMLLDMQRDDVMGRLSIRLGQRPEITPVPGLFPGHSAARVPHADGRPGNAGVVVNMPHGSLGPLRDEMLRRNPAGGPVTIDLGPMGTMESTIIPMNSPAAMEYLRRMTQRD